MKKISKKRPLLLLAIAVFGFAGAGIMNSCKTSEAIAAKSGAQLWGENCRRCHNAPDPSTFSNDQWETIGMHMQTRALLTNEERDKIVNFLKQQ